MSELPMRIRLALIKADIQLEEDIHRDRIAPLEGTMRSGVVALYRRRRAHHERQMERLVVGRQKLEDEIRAARRTARQEKRRV